jgi:hypothetical protein
LPASIENAERVGARRAELQAMFWAIREWLQIVREALVVVSLAAAVAYFIVVLIEGRIDTVELLGYGTPFR